MKKIFVLATVFLFFCSIDCFAAKISNDITDRTMDRNKTVGNIPREDDGKWKYPCVGASAGETYYLDHTSCTYWINGNVATAACIVYLGGRGAAPDGGPAKITPMTFQFDTYKSKSKRKIFLKSVIGKNGEENSKYWLEQDNGFLLSLFRKVSKYSGLSKYLD